MKRIGLTQRVENVQSYAERRDCLDQRWSALVFELDAISIPLFNVSYDKVNDLLDNLDLDVIFLTGGNSITCVNPLANDVAPERDAFEFSLLKMACERDIPVIGICRGMQIINLYFDGKLLPIENHVGVYHPIRSLSDDKLPNEVNSYHNWGIDPDSLSSDLKVLATDDSGYIEAFEHKEHKILGIMWHPEREKPLNPLDLQLIKRFL